MDRRKFLSGAASAVVAGALPTKAQRKTDSGPDCSGSWPTNMAQGMLKNAGLLRSEEIDFTKTTTQRLASQRIGKHLWHQVYLVTFVQGSGENIQAIAIHDASTEECSMTGVDLYVISKHLNSGK